MHCCRCIKMHPTLLIAISKVGCIVMHHLRFNEKSGTGSKLIVTLATSSECQTVVSFLAGWVLLFSVSKISTLRSTPTMNNIFTNLQNFSLYFPEKNYKI